MGEWSEHVKFLVALVSIVNPIGAIPLFVTFTNSRSLQDRRRTGFIAALTVFLVLGVTLLTGEAILRFFGITISSFRVGGGLLLLLMAISMMHGRLSTAKQTDEEAQDAADKNAVAVVPLGIPLLAGPGAISTVIVYANRDTSPAHYVVLGAEIALVAFIVWAVFRAGPYIAVVLRQTGINIVTRVMGLIMAAIGVEFIIQGLKELLPLLRGGTGA